MFYSKVFNSMNFKSFFLVLKIGKVSNLNVTLILIFTFSIIILDALGIGILLPIGEYILHKGNGSLPDTVAWSLIKKVFNFVGIKPDIFLVTFIAMVLILSRQILNYFKALYIQTTRLKIIKEFRKILFVKLLNIDFYYMKDFTTGAYNNVMNNEVEKVGVASIAPIECLTSFALLLSYVALMLWISIKATVIVIFLGFISFFILRRYLKKIALTSQNIININNNFSQNLVERLLAAKLIRLSRTLKEEVQNNNKLLNDQFKNNISLSKIQILTNTTIEPLLMIIAMPIIIIAISIGFPLSKLGVFVILLSRFIPVFRSFFDTLQNYVQHNESSINILTLLEKLNKQKENRSGNKEIKNKINTIEFKNVYFNYLNNKTPILKNRSFLIKGSRINTLVGDSGTGKSTIINMLTRLLEAKKGEILINKINIKEIQIDNLRSLCSFIDQKPFFFKGTIYQNITYGKKTTLKQCIEAAKLSNAHNFISKLPNKYNYKIGESGSGLSGGQLQRIDLTKAIIANKPILILDEPTSNLDEDNKEEICKTLWNINKKIKNTIIIVSHDKNIIKYSHNIISIR